MWTSIVSSFNLFGLCMTLTSMCGITATNKRICIHVWFCFILTNLSCHTCTDRELVRKREFLCPICQTPVKRVTLTQRTLDAVQCEKDTSWRRRLLAVYNKTPSDFSTLKEYNDYLEEVEDMIYSIVNEEPNAEECKAKIKEYELAHRAEIVIRQSHRADEERSIQDQIAAEQLAAQRNRIQLEEERQHILYTKRKFKQESTEVLLGERAEVSAELLVAQMQGYKNEIKRRGPNNNVPIFVSPKVREPPTGLKNESNLGPESYLKRQAAGGGVPVGSIVNQERNWNETFHSLFALKKSGNEQLTQ
jgi:hypothetical protein